MESSWDDFERPERQTKIVHVEDAPKDVESSSTTTAKKDCDWGFTRPDCDLDPTESSSECSQFISLYEQYLSDKQSLPHRTKNHQLYANNPSKALREWFDNEGHEYASKLSQTRDSHYKCSIDVPVGDQDFTFESEVHQKKQTAIDEVCLDACKLLDECDLLKSWQQDQGSKDPDRKRRFDEANKEDDIELDNTKSISSQEPKHKKKSLESLRAKWTQLNMTILGLKAKLVKLDLSVSHQKERSDNRSKERSTSDDDDDEDPLDAFMSNLDKKTELTLDDKIEKSRIKSQICALEREQDEISGMIDEINS